MTKPIPLDLATRAAERLARDASVELVHSTDPRRILVCYAVAAAHKVAGTGLALADIEARVTITLPGAGAAVKLLALIPSIPGVPAAVNGLAASFLGAAARATEHPAIYLSPAAESDPIALLSTVAHELAHVGQIREGGFFGCLAYLAVPEDRAGCEAVAYANTMAVRVLLGGVDASVAEGDALLALRSYGLDADAMALARGIILSTSESLAAGADPGGVVAGVRAALAAEGWVR